MANSQPKNSAVEKPDARAQIVEAGIVMLSERPFASVTVRDLMRNTGFTRAVFYKHFDDLYSLITEIVEQFAGQIFDNAASWIDAPSSRSPSQVHETISAVAHFVATLGPTAQSLSDAAAGQNEQLREAWRDDLLGEMIRRVAQAIREEQAAGKISKAIDAENTSLALNLMNERVMLDQFGRYGNADPDVVGRYLAEIWVATLYGIAPGDDL